MLFCIMEILGLILSLFFISMLLLIYKHITATRRSRSTLTPPGPKGLPLIGNLHQLGTSSQHEHLARLSKHYGPIMSLKLGFKPTIVISSSKLAKEVLKTQDLNFASRPPFLGLRKLSYNGLDLGFAPYGPYWREMKKFCAIHLFSSQRVQSFRPNREKEVAHMIRKISQFEESQKVLNLNETLISYSNDLICSIAFEKKYGYCEEEEELGIGQRHNTHWKVLFSEVQTLLVEFYFSDFFPMLGFVDRLKGTVGRLEKAFKELDMFYERVIHDHMDPSRPKCDETQVVDIIDIFLGIMKDHSFPIDLTIDHIKAMLMNIFVAGTDTSTVAIVWAMTALLKHPEAMNKVQRETRSLFGDKDFINEDDIQRLPYLKAVVKETLRLFPPSPLLLPRQTIEKCNIHGYEIQAGTLVHVNAWAIARDPENWKDPEEFSPERFYNGSSIEFKGNDFVLIPFGGGRRMCPAMNMGLAAVELALANLVHSFDWELPHGIDKEAILDTSVKPGITMHKNNDLYLVPKKHSI